MTTQTDSFRFSAALVVLALTAVAAPHTASRRRPGGAGALEGRDRRRALPGIRRASAGRAAARGGTG